MRSWKRLPAEQEAQALRDHAHALNRLRRALLTARSLESPLETERTAARRALQPSAIAREEQTAVSRKRCYRAVMLGLAFLALGAAALTTFVYMS